MVVGKMNKLKVLYEDNHVIVVVKKENVLSQADSTNDVDLLSMVKNYIKEEYKKPGNVYIGLVHRLDRPVGGVMVFARTSKAAKRLNEQIKNHDVKKEYLALLDGILKEKKGTLKNYLLKDEQKKISKVVNKDTPNSKYAELNYEVIDYVDNKTLVKVELITGRHHQIRLQFSNLGYPIYGDQKYGRRNKDEQIRLFAYKLSFIHPVTKEKMNFKYIPKWEELKDETIIHRL